MRTIRPRGVLRIRVLGFLAVVAVGVFAGANSALADVTGTGGGAYVASASLTGTSLAGTAVNVTVGPLQSVIAPAPPIAFSPTTNSATLLAADITALGLAGVTATGGSASSSTSGATGSPNLGPTGAVTSSAQVLGASAATPLIGGVAFSTTSVSSTCTATDSSVTGSTTIVSGQAATGTGGTLAAVTATPAPNTMLNISYTTMVGSRTATVTGTITLNEQTTSSVFMSNSITVNAVHIVETVSIPAFIVGGMILFPASTQTLDVILGHSACTVTGPDVNAQLVATFRSFNAQLAKRGVQLNWRTASQIDVAGYNVYRQVHGRKVRINKHLIPARNSGRYSFLDRSRKAGASYWLQTVNLDGSRSWHGPARVAARRLAV